MRTKTTIYFATVPNANGDMGKTFEMRAPHFVQLLPKPHDLLKFAVEAHGGFKPLESVEFREGRRFDHGNDLKLMEPARDVERFTSHPFRIR
jgi:hypothetical protein